MSSSTSPHHTIDYIEWKVADLAAAKTFYERAFGWTFNDYGPGYSGINGNGKEVGGFEQVAEGESVLVSSGPLVVLYSDDLEASRAAVVVAGGKICAEPFAFPGGKRFHFVDPSGHELAVWTKLKVPK